MGLESGDEGGGAIDPEASAAVGPEEGLAEAFDEEPVGLGLGMGIFEDGRTVVKDGAVSLFEGDEHGDLGLGGKGAASEGGGPESRIENGRQFRGWQQRGGDHGTNPAESEVIPARVGAFLVRGQALGVSPYPAAFGAAVSPGKARVPRAALTPCPAAQELDSRHQGTRNRDDGRLRRTFRGRTVSHRPFPGPPGKAEIAQFTV